jgi:hypothetical protein
VGSKFSHQAPFLFLTSGRNVPLLLGLTPPPHHHHRPTSVKCLSITRSLGLGPEGGGERGGSEEAYKVGAGRWWYMPGGGGDEDEDEEEGASKNEK